MAKCHVAAAKCLGQTAWLGQISSNNTRLSTVLEKILETEESNKKSVCLSVNVDVKKYLSHTQKNQMFVLNMPLSRE